MAKRVGGDKWLFFVTLLLIVVGLAMVFSASAIVAQERYHSAVYLRRQAGHLGAVLGCSPSCSFSRASTITSTNLRASSIPPSA